MILLCDEKGYTWDEVCSFPADVFAEMMQMRMVRGEVERSKDR